MAKNKKKHKGHKKCKESKTITTLNDEGIGNMSTNPAMSSLSTTMMHIMLSPKQQKTIIQQLLTQADAHGLMIDDKRFVLAAKWWDRWRQYVGYDENDEVETITNPKGVLGTSTPPSAINNLPLLQLLPNSTVDELMGAPLHHNLRENYHYVLVPMEVWDALICWYGGGPAIARFVVQVGSPELGNCFTRVDLYPELASIEDHIKDEDVQSSPSVRKSVSTVNSSMSKICGACRTTHNKPIKRCGGCQVIFYCNSSCQRSHWRAHKHACNSSTNGSITKEQVIVSAHASERRGKMGLRNLGNTCFMNSALQCLSHMEVLTSFFLTNAFINDVNKHNVLGTGGNLVMEYDNLLKELWYGSASSYAPGAIKRSIARFAPQFSGFQQHDAQELLAYLLDGLHEDLNRVHEKPYTETVESNGQESDADVAQEAWKRHSLRNDSIIVDHVQGQFKSTVVCPICTKVSITFDPFNCIQLELPISHERKMQVIVICEGEKPMRYGIQVPKKGNMLNLKKIVSSYCQVDPKLLIAADIYQSQVFRVIGDSERLTKIRDDDRIVLYHTKSLHEETVTSRTYYGFLYHRGPISMVSDPLLFSFVADTTCAQMLEKWRDILSDHVTSISGDPSTPIALEALAECIFLCNQEGTLLRNQSVPLCSDSPFIDYVILTPEEGVKDIVYVSLNWRASSLASLSASPTFPRPDLDSVVNHETIRRQQEGNVESDGLTLADCFHNFTKPETLDQDNLWYCSTCRTHRQARKQMEIWKLPNVLIVSLKRFEYRNEVLRDKLDAYVDFPLDGLDMTSFCLEPPSSSLDSRCYDLFAVSNHYGGMGFGHYTAFARSLSTVKEPYPGWYSFDDSQVSPVMPNQVKSNAAYILFYKRRQIESSDQV